MSSKPESTNKLDNPYSARPSRSTRRPPNSLERFHEGINEASSRLGSILLPEFEMKETHRKFGFFGFWDIGTTKLPEGYAVNNFKRRIGAALKTRNQDYFCIGLLGYGNFRLFDHHEIAVMKNYGFKLCHVERRARTCTRRGCGKVIESHEPEDQYGSRYKGKMDLADALVVQSMYFYRMDVGTPANMLVLSSDPDFATTVATLKWRGVTVFVAAEQDANPILLRSGHAGWYWSKLINGEGSDF